MITIDRVRTTKDLVPAIDAMFALSAEKIRSIEDTWVASEGSPVFTVNGRYTTRGWTDWTQGFQFGSALLQFDATGDKKFLELGRKRTLERMAPHVSATGVHDHGFNNVSTYGALWRLAREHRFKPPAGEIEAYRLALKISGAVQASRWTRLPFGGFIHSFNGAHSLFVDTIRTLRSLAIAWQLGHRMHGEQDTEISLIDRLIWHAASTAEFSVYYGHGRDIYDIRGRVAHESLFNPLNGSYRGPSSQQGYSPFTTWTRGLAWALLGFAELLEFIDLVPNDALERHAGRVSVEGFMMEAVRATADFYIDHAAAADGVPYWDTGAPGLVQLGDWADRDADPFNPLEPVDSSAASIAAQGLIRFGRRLEDRNQDGSRYTQAGLRTLATLLDTEGPYLSQSEEHQGLLLHAIYHRPNGWDARTGGAPTPRGESAQWGDYHLRETALLVRRLAHGEPYLTFFAPEAGS